MKTFPADFVMHTLVHRSFLALGADEAQNVGQRGTWFFLLGRDATVLSTLGGVVRPSTRGQVFKQVPLPETLIISGAHVRVDVHDLQGTMSVGDPWA